MLLQLILLAAPLPADVWSVGRDGKTCVQLEEALAAELANWDEDPESSAPDDGVYGRVNPKDRRQLVLLFKSKKVCERIVWAVGEERKENRPRQTLDDKQVREKVEAFAVNDADAKTAWTRLSAKEKKAIHAEARELFSGDVNRVRVRKRIAALAKKKKLRQADSVRLRLWKRLHALVFGEEWVAEEAEPADR